MKDIDSIDQISRVIHLCEAERVITKYLDDLLARGFLDYF